MAQVLSPLKIPEKCLKTPCFEIRVFSGGFSNPPFCAPSLCHSRHVKVPWKTGMLICHPVTSRPLIFPQKEAVLFPCNFATKRLTAWILRFDLPWTSQFMKWRTLSQRSETDPEIKGSRSQQRSVTHHPSISDCTETQWNTYFGTLHTLEERSYRTLITSQRTLP